jgi:hypothetical protein
MNNSQIEKNLNKLLDNFSEEDFIFDLLLSYGLPKATITLLKKGKHNLSKTDDKIILKNKLFFKPVHGIDLHETIDSLQNDEITMRHNPRFIIVTDYETLLSADTKTKEHLDIPLKDLSKHFAFFLPWAGIEKYEYKDESPADRKAAEKMAKLYDHILLDNHISDESKIHDLNIFLSRLLFCFFAEDTSIFKNSIFTSSIASHTQSDGSDLDKYLEKLFEVLNTEDRSKHPAHFQDFPYVNGGLFEKKHWVPKFSSKARKTIIACGELDWAEINPDIFGSMIQAVVDPSQRGSLGMHYTSVPNIMKVIEPLFLNELKDAFKQAKDNKKKLNDLLYRISKIKFFDPACGSGNFLIIAYKEIRRLQMVILKEIGAISYPRIKLTNFFGIEIDDFAHEIAKLSLYLAEHQMNVEFSKEFGVLEPTLPLKNAGHIIKANAARVKWDTICSIKEGDEIYLFGNPPYLGARNQNSEQKQDMYINLKEIKKFKNLDYIAIWFYKAANYIKISKASAIAFVSTNSITQGAQVPIFWPHILKNGSVQIFFAHNSFKWTNNAKKNAGVTCVVIGLKQSASINRRLLYNSNRFNVSKHINAYLIQSKDIYVYDRKTPLSLMPPINYGSFALDDGNYTLKEEECRELLENMPEASYFIKPFIGARELIEGRKRYCIWIKGEDYDKAKKIPEINRRIEKVKAWRGKSDRAATAKLAQTPYRFAEIRQPLKTYLAFPTVSSER